MDIQITVHKINIINNTTILTTYAEDELHVALWDKNFYENSGDQPFYAFITIG